MEMSGKPKADLSFPDNVAVQGDRKYLETYQNKNFEAKNNICIPERKKGIPLILFLLLLVKYTF
jgi:hypothetical protein